MRLAIMQPYLFPYIGYFQLIHATDTFVIYDDVNYIKGGWINRNFILSQGEKTRITLQVIGASPNVYINQVKVGGNKNKLLKTIAQSYAKAPQYNVVMPIIEEIMMCDENDLSKFIAHSLKLICAYLGMNPSWIFSSDLKCSNNSALKGQERVLAICDELGAKKYINVPGGRALYNKDAFEKRGINLSFIIPDAINYQQFDGDFEVNLSIVDVMMFNDVEECRRLIGSYELEQ